MIADEKCRLLPLFLHSPVLFGGYSSDSEQLHGESLNYNGGMILLLPAGLSETKQAAVQKP